MSRRSTTGCSGQAILGRFPRKKRCLLPANTLRIGSFLLRVLSSPAHGEYPLSKGDLGVAGRPMGLFGWPSRLGREVGGPLPPRALLGCIKWRFGSYNTNRTLEYCAVPYTLHLWSPLNKCPPFLKRPLILILSLDWQENNTGVTYKSQLNRSTSVIYSSWHGVGGRNLSLF